jgi:hypothetical protein
MNKAILVSIIAVIALMTLTIVSADSHDLTTGSWSVEIDGTPVTESDIAGIEAGETVPIEITFKAADCVDDVWVKAEIEVDGEEVEDRTGRFDLIEDSWYTKRLTLDVPEDIEDRTDEITLTITITDGDDKEDMEYTILLQRETYNVDFLDIDMPSEAEAGSVVAFDVVLKNWGSQDLEDVFVRVSVPDLAVSKKVYFGDIDPLDECEDWEDECDGHDNCKYSFKDCDWEDAAERRVYLTIPASASSGVYDVEIEAYNSDSSANLKRSLIVSGKEDATNVLTGASSKTLDIGEEVTYDIVIVNSGSSMKVYTLTPEQISGLIVDVDPVVTVPADASRTVRVRVKATESAEEGTHLVKINVESDGELIQQANLSANVERGTAQVANSVVVLTIVLVIIFVVLLIILIVLLTKRPATMETEETSYY